MFVSIVRRPSGRNAQPAGCRISALVAAARARVDCPSETFFGCDRAQRGSVRAVALADARGSRALGPSLAQRTRDHPPTSCRVFGPRRACPRWRRLREPPKALSRPATRQSLRSVSPRRKGGETLLVIAATISLIPAMLNAGSLRWIIHRVLVVIPDLL